MNAMVSEERRIPVTIDLSKDVKESVSAFSYISDIPVVYYDNEGKMQWRTGNESRICDDSKSYQDPTSGCRRNLLSSMNYSATLGEAYVFICHGGLVNIAVSILDGVNAKGCFIAGPVIMGELRESNLARILSVGQFPQENYSKLLMQLKSMKIRSPREVSSLALLFYNSVVSSLSNSDVYLHTKIQHQNQAKLSSLLQDHKKSHAPMEYPFAMERQMIRTVKAGEAASASEYAKQLTEEIFILESGDVDAVRARLFGLYAVLVREAYEGKDLEYSESDYELQDVTSLYDVHDSEGLVERFCEMVFALADRLESALYTGNSAIVKQAVKYIHDNYAYKVTLGKVATDHHVNPSYLSGLFKQEMGLGFAEYLIDLRVKEARHLLRYSNLRMIDIAQSCGFDDQSYFTKVFRKRTGMTPKEYRKNNDSTVGNSL